MAWQRDITGEHREKVISQFMLLAEAKGKKAIFHDPQISSGVGFVYCLVIGSDLYVGSTENIYSRIRNHICDLVARQHPFEHIQAAYNRVKRAKLYAVMQVVGDKDALLEAETLCIMLMRPTLNKTLPRQIRNLVWQPMKPRIVLQEGQRACPWCGYPINVTMSLGRGEALTEEEIRQRKEAELRHEELCRKAKERAHRRKQAKKQEDTINNE